MIQDVLTIHVDTKCNKNLLFPKTTTKNKKASIKLYKHTFKLDKGLGFMIQYKSNNFKKNYKR